MLRSFRLYLQKPVAAADLTTFAEDVELLSIESIICDSGVWDRVSAKCDREREICA